MQRPKDAFFAKMEHLGLALTYGDVRLKTDYAQVLPDEVVLKSLFSRNVPLLVPITSAAMDTVTEHRLAIELAKLGGLGVIHRNNSPEEQAMEVARVKYHLNGIIQKPVCVPVDWTIEQVLRRREEKGYSFHSFLVIDGEQKLVGVLSGNDFDFCDQQSLSVQEVMTKDPVTAPEETGIDAAYSLMKQHGRKVLPIVRCNGTVAALYTWSDVKRIRSDRAQTHNVDQRGQLRVGAAIGIGTPELERVQRLREENVDVVVIDTAHADSASVIQAIHDLKAAWPDQEVVAGNVSEPASVERLIAAGIDGVKIGQGPGSICTTRKIAGIGCPQVTAVYQCSMIAEQHGVPVCADGGITHSGDITVALAAGAHSVMLGNLLAGTQEAPGDIVYLDGRPWKSYRGMGSLGAMQESATARARYGQRSTGKDQLVPEGVEGLVHYKGALAQVLHQYVGGLRRGMGYVGAVTIEELRLKCGFMRITLAGENESHPHDVFITQDAPNYHRGQS